MEHEYALWGFDDKNRPVARENLTIEAVNAVRDDAGYFGRRGRLTPAPPLLGGENVSGTRTSSCRRYYGS
jgi:hypothetical protein